MVELADTLYEMGEFEREELVDEGVALAGQIGDRPLELRFELRRLYLRLMRHPKQVLLADISADAQAIAAEAAGLGDPLSEGEALSVSAGCRANRDTGGRGTVARASECFDAPGHSSELAFVLTLSFSFQGPHTIAQDIELAERALADGNRRRRLKRTASSAWQ